MSRATIGVLATTAWLTACGGIDLNLTGEGGCSNLLAGTADKLELTLSTSEYSTSRHFMVVGEVGQASAEITADGAFLDAPATIRSSNQAVVRVSAGGALVAVGAGSASITAEGCGLSDHASVEVSSAPLPLDRLLVQVSPGSPGTATNDANGNLALLALQVGDTAPVEIGANRGGEWIRGTALQPTVVSSDNVVAEILGHAVVGHGAGSAQVTVTVRNLGLSFQVQVAAP